MYLGIDIIFHENNCYFLEVNTGVPGCLTDIVEGAVYLEKRIIEASGDNLIDEIKKSKSLFLRVNELCIEKHNNSFYEHINNDLRIRLLKRYRLNEALPEEYNQPVILLQDKWNQYKLLSSLKKKSFLLPETYHARNREELNIILEIFEGERRRCVVKPCRGWHGEGIVCVERFKKTPFLKKDLIFPCIVQEFIDSSFMGKHFDFRILSFDGTMVAIIARIGRKRCAVSNISAGGRVILCFSSRDKGKELLEFIKLKGKRFIRHYTFEWEDIIYNLSLPGIEIQETCYEPCICLISPVLFRRFESICTEIDTVIEKFLR